MLVRALLVLWALSASPLGAHEAGINSPPSEFERQYCDARTIAPFTKTLTLEEQIRVFDELEQSGAIGSQHAENLRRLAREARETDDLAAWVERECAPKEEV